MICKALFRCLGHSPPIVLLHHLHGHTHPCCLLPAWQVVWKSTTKVGCGAVMCGSSRIYTCSYDPPGNYVGQYTQNVEVRACKTAGCM